MFRNTFEMRRNTFVNRLNVPEQTQFLKKVFQNIFHNVPEHYINVPIHFWKYSETLLKYSNGTFWNVPETNLVMNNFKSLKNVLEHFGKHTVLGQTKSSRTLSENILMLRNTFFKNRVCFETLLKYSENNKNLNVFGTILKFFQKIFQNTMGHLSKVLKLVWEHLRTLLKCSGMLLKCFRNTFFEMFRNTFEKHYGTPEHFWKYFETFLKC